MNKLIPLKIVKQKYSNHNTYMIWSRMRERVDLFLSEICHHGFEPVDSGLIDFFVSHQCVLSFFQPFRNVGVFLQVDVDGLKMTTNV